MCGVEVTTAGIRYKDNAGTYFHGTCHKRMVQRALTAERRQQRVEAARADVDAVNAARLDAGPVHATPVIDDARVDSAHVDSAQVDSAQFGDINRLDAAPVDTAQVDAQVLHGSIQDDTLFVDLLVRIFDGLLLSQSSC